MINTADMSILAFRNLAYDSQKVDLGVTDNDTRSTTLKNAVLWRMFTKKWINARKVKYGIKT